MDTRGLQISAPARGRRETMTSSVPAGRTWRGRLCLVVMAGLTAMLAAPAASAATADSSRLRIVDLGTLGGTCCSDAEAVNDRGVVVGGSNGRAFLWRSGRMVDLGTLGGDTSHAADINNLGTVVGDSAVAGGSTHAFVWRSGRMIDIGTLGGNISYATAINDQGDVVGFSETAPGTFVLHAFLWHNGRMRDLRTLDGGFARAGDINGQGTVVGEASVDGMNSVPVRWTRGGIRGLSAEFGSATAINDQGQVAGYSYLTQGSFLWSRGRMIDIGMVSGSAFTQAQAINNSSQVVGYSDFDAWLWHAGEMTLLPRLAGSTTGARDINNRGQVVGYSATTPDGANYHAVLWTR